MRRQPGGDQWDQLHIQQRWAFIEEVNTSVFLIVEGLISLNSLSAANDFSHLPLQLLSQGFERLLKLGVVLEHWSSKGSLPPPQQVRGYGHDLMSLSLDLIERCEAAGYPGDRIASREDVAFVRNNELLQRLLSLMSTFGKRGRYHHLDVVLDPSTHEGNLSPQDEFAEIENMVLDHHPEWFARIAEPEFRDFYPVLYRDLTSCLQRFARSICRLFAFDALGRPGKQVSSQMHMFLMLRDEELGRAPRRWFEN